MSALRQYYLYLTVFVTGAAVLAIEILGTRVLAPFYGSTIFVWSSLISVTLGFLALGYWLGGRTADRRPHTHLFFGSIFFAGLFLILVTKFSQPVLIWTDSFGLRFGPLVAAAILFAPTLFFLGVLSPFAIRLRTRLLEKVGTRSGDIFAFSTLGSLVGALAAGFVLLPLLPLSQIFLLLSALLLLTALIGFLLFSDHLPATALIVAATAAGILFVLPSWEIQETRRVFDIIHHEQSFYADLKVKYADVQTCLLLDGATHSCQSNQDNNPVWSYILELGRVAQEREPESVLVLGLGAGSIARVLPEGVQADFVEIDERVAELAQTFFGFRPTENRRLVIDDARHYLRTTEKRYDMIILDVFAGNTFPIHLFTKEALEEMRSRLTEDGLALAFLEGKLPGDPEDLQLDSFNRTARAVFPSVAWTSSDASGETFLVAHFSQSPGYAPARGGEGMSSRKPFQEISYRFGGGILLTDDLNPLETIATRIREVTRQKFVQIQGYTPFFSM